MINVLKVLNTEMTRLLTNYAFDDWNTKKVLPYYVGEISEIITGYEDGKSEYQFIITGTDKDTYTNLLNALELIKKEYKYGKKITLDNGVIVIIYDNSLTIPIENEDIKRIQINLSVRLWEN